MLTRLTRAQVFAFVLLGLIALAYASIVYVKLPQKLGIGRHQVSVELPNTADLYTAAGVTLRGHQIGEVKSIDLAERGVVAILDLDDEAKIPVDSVAEVRSVSAIGEQYLNFVPKTEGGPVLEPGDVVPVANVKLPVPEVDVLNNVDRLVSSLNVDDLNTTVSELGTGFANTGESLGRLLDATSDLTRTAQDYLPQLRGLIDNLGPFLNTQRRVGPQLRSEFDDLNTFTTALRDSDDDLRGTIDAIPPVQEQVRSIVDGLEEPLPKLLHDLTNVGEVAKVYLPGIQQTLVVLPTGINLLQNTVYASSTFGAAKLNFKAVLEDPPACNTGFLPDGTNRDPNDLTYRPPAYNANCKSPKDAPTGVRMGKNYPCPNKAATSTYASACGLNFQSKEDAQRAEDEATATMKKVFDAAPDSRKVPVNSIYPVAGSAGYEDGALTDPASPEAIAAQTQRGPRVPLSSMSLTAKASTTSTYDTATGAFLAPGGAPFLLGGARPVVPGGGAGGGWQSLITGPLGVPTK